MKMDSKSKVDDWLYISITDLEKLCILNTQDSISGKLMSEYYDVLTKFINPIEEEGIEESEFIMHYIYNSDLVNKLKEVISHVQNCLDKEKRLDSKEIATVMERVLKAHAVKIVERKSEFYV